MSSTHSISLEIQQPRDGVGEHCLSNTLLLSVTVCFHHPAVPHPSCGETPSHVFLSVTQHTYPLPAQKLQNNHHAGKIQPRVSISITQVNRSTILVPMLGSDHVLMGDQPPSSHHCKPPVHTGKLPFTLVECCPLPCPAGAEIIGSLLIALH